MRNISPRDVILVLLGAGCMHIASLLISSPEPALLFTARFKPPETYDQVPVIADPVVVDEPLLPELHHASSSPPKAGELDIPLLEPSKFASAISHTTLVKHAPGWTIFENIYMSNGTLFIVTDERDSWPSIEYMTSTGLPALNTPESIEERMPTARDIDFITTAEAKERWADEEDDEFNRVFPVEGDTVCSS